MGIQRTRTLRGALAGAFAAGVWAAQQPLDKRAFGVDYDDCELLGSAVTRGARAYALGVGMHVANGAVFGAVYSHLARSLPGPPVVRGVTAGLAEHLTTWPALRLMHLHPQANRFPQLWGNHAAFAQASWRHALFGAVLGLVEGRLNGTDEEPSAAEPEPDVAAGNGHARVDRLTVVSRS